jgi:8-oxo-dGTP pyrophosphatase MutT (NUDIX family)
MNMERKYGPWTIKSKATEYKDEFVELQVDQVIKPNGEPGSYATLKMKTGVAILPLDTNGDVYLTKQFRYALGKQSIEVISGGIDEDGNPLEAAQREAKEELGVEAEEWIELGIFDLETSIIKGPVYLYLAKNLAIQSADQDSTEDIQTLKVSMQKAIDMVMKGEITHGPSCILILKASLILHKDS